MRRRTPLSNDPAWYKDAILYELRVRSFFDSNGDGIGDFNGLAQKLDYLEDLGVNTLWLLPFYPSPMRDDGYDIADYVDVHPDLGTLADFRRFLEEAHRRALRVVTELVINHTSDQHPWFQRARLAPAGSPDRDFYVWSETPEKYQDARIIFQDFEKSNWTWDPVAKSYYWHRFFSHQPDLNFRNPLVKKALFDVLDFWMEMGVDGVRLDAVPYLFEEEGTNCENLPETHQLLQDLRAHVDGKFKNRMLLAEANQWPEDAVAYLDPRECHMAFHFPIMPRMYMALRMEDRFPITDILAQTPWPKEGCQWALFLRNHDELTLEMVTDEERDYMYTAFARESRMRVNVGIRRRFAPLMGNNRRSMELLNALLCSLPGTPVLYYGDEIGMGDNIWLGDRDSVRTPMQWNGDRNAGFSRANPQQLVLPVIIDPEYHFETVNVEAQQGNPHSLLWWMRRLIALRKRYPAFGRGGLTMLSPENPKVLAFVRTLGDEKILVVANLSRYLQHVSLDLSPWKDLVPIELFGRTRFPPIGESEWSMSLSPHAFAWFSLEPRRTADLRREGAVLPRVDGPWEGGVPGADARLAIEAALPAWLSRRPAGRRLPPVRVAEITDLVPIPGETPGALLMLTVECGDRPPEPWVVPLARVSGPQAAALRERAPEAVLAEAGEDGSIVVDALADAGFSRALLAAFLRKEPLRGTAGTAAATLWSHEVVDLAALEPKHLRGDHHNTLVVFGDRLVLKLLARPDEGQSPEIEELAAIAPIAPAIVAPLFASVEYRRERGVSLPIAVVQGYVHHQSDAWVFVIEEVKRFYERALTSQLPAPPPRPLTAMLLDPEPVPPAISELLAPFTDSAALLGRRTAELHGALASVPRPEFLPEPYSQLYQRSVYQGMRNLAGYVLRDLQAKRESLPENARAGAAAVLASSEAILDRFAAFRELRAGMMKRVRVHGDLHLREVLWTGKDFVFVDFEGDRARTLTDRRRKRASLRDVASLIASAHSAALTARRQHAREGVLERESEMIAQWTDAWHAWISRSLLHAYLEHIPQGLAPRDARPLSILLDAFLLEKLLYDLGTELDVRPDRAWIPLEAILRLIERA